MKVVEEIDFMPAANGTARDGSYEHDRNRGDLITSFGYVTVNS